MSQCKCTFTGTACRDESEPEFFVRGAAVLRGLDPLPRETTAPGPGPDNPRYLPRETGAEG